MINNNLKKDGRALIDVARDTISLNRMKKLIVTLIVVLIFLAIILGRQNAVAPIVENDETIELTGEVAAGFYTWEFVEGAVATTTGIPKTAVILKAGTKVYSAGTYEGTCFDVTASTSAWILLEGEMAGAICWWAGGGTELGVFTENGKQVVKKGELDEGSDEVPGTRGNFVTQFEIE
ncbi:MAG: hypothetical protein A2928_04475 [Candidatus Taylorbacteria bacterium RIFCSPLOWO2_01_FULL_45_15b]|uniref:Uncharacterized protein n=1 Tax=Candidatus Taylorbacteria bacterium RIFCSPLOWO2_01_FULL_45_15b TaxID=1802319 RepID=A0A1G2N9W4_9BACT|nr:MAG: hypothetical protein A2928_04475 [Candidatus Taylorbacteria bacterium RIFCSPLOWO2_01_FULL_45_15b]